jgi:hypothetical protein
MKVEKYVLLIADGFAYLRGVSPDALKGYFNVEAHKLVTDKSLNALRRHGRKLAATNKIAFEDATITSDR